MSLLAPIERWARRLIREEIELARQAEVNRVFDLNEARIDTLEAAGHDVTKWRAARRAARQKALRTSMVIEARQPALSVMAPDNSAVFATASLTTTGLRYLVWAVDRCGNLTLLCAGRETSAIQDLASLIQTRILDRAWGRSETICTRVLLVWTDRLDAVVAAQALLGSRLDLAKVLEGRLKTLINGPRRVLDARQDGQIIGQVTARNVYSQPMNKAWRARVQGKGCGALTCDPGLAWALDWDYAALAEAALHEMGIAPHA